MEIINARGHVIFTLKCQENNFLGISLAQNKIVHNITTHIFQPRLSLHFSFFIYLFKLDSLSMLKKCELIFNFTGYFMIILADYLIEKQVDNSNGC